MFGFMEEYPIDLNESIVDQTPKKQFELENPVNPTAGAIPEVDSEFERTEQFQLTDFGMRDGSRLDMPMAPNDVIIEEQVDEEEM